MMALASLSQAMLVACDRCALCDNTVMVTIAVLLGEVIDNAAVDETALKLMLEADGYTTHSLNDVGQALVAPFAISAAAGSMSTEGVGRGGAVGWSSSHDLQDI